MRLRESESEQVKTHSGEENKSIKSMPEQKSTSSTRTWAEGAQQAPEPWWRVRRRHPGGRDQDPGGVRAWGRGRTTVRPALAVKGHKEASFSASCCSHYTPGKHMCPHPCLPAYGHPCAFYFLIKLSQNTYEIGPLIVYRPWAQSSLHA